MLVVNTSITFSAAHHRLNGSSSHVLTATSHSYGKAKNSTPTESKPLIWLRWNLAQFITSARRPPVQNFMQIRTWGPSWQMGEIYTQNFYLHIPFFQKLTYRSDPWVDFSARWLKRRGLTQGCAFLGVKKLGSNIWPLKNPPKVEIWQKNGKFSAKTPLYKIFICKLPLIVIIAP